MNKEESVPKLNIKKNQIRFNNLNGYMAKARKMQEQNNSASSQQINNNFIEVNNSVIIVQKNSRDSSPLNTD